MEASKDLESLEDRLGYRFRNRTLLAQALTHASAQTRNNERLEFLGDAVLNLVVAEALFRNLPNQDEGRLTELKAALVSRSTLNRVAEELGVSAYRPTCSGLNREEGLPRSLSGNALEAILGAIYLDSPSDTRLRRAGHLALSWLKKEIDSLEENWERDRSKQVLQTWCQRELGIIPTYELIRAVENGGETLFEVQVSLANKSFPTAVAANKKEAERAAAWGAISQLRKDGKFDA